MKGRNVSEMCRTRREKKREEKKKKKALRDLEMSCPAAPQNRKPQSMTAAGTKKTNRCL